MSRLPVLLSFLALAAPVAGAAEPASASLPRPETVAARAAAVISVDGRADEPCWKEASARSLGLLRDASPRESGEVRFAWDEENLYLFADLTDSDIAAGPGGDDVPLQARGDVLELFIGPEDQTWYWEIHYAPDGARAAFFYASAGRRMAEATLVGRPLRQVRKILPRGTVEDWRDRDRGWNLEAAIPWSELLSVVGPTAKPPRAWRLLVGRYNYSRWLDEVEISFWPPLPARAFHHPARFAALRLEPAPVRAPAEDGGKSSKRSNRKARG